MFNYKIAQFIEREGLLQANGKVLVAISGGADSVALLRVLLSLQYSCEAAHCNFHLRGEESNRDETFVREMCTQLNVSLHVIRFDTIEYAADKKISIEMAARELRYTWFAELKNKTGASAIAVAHHQDDSNETMLINLIRGTGINGLLGIRPRNGDVIRPLLGVSREEILKYLRDSGQDFVTDSTNLLDDFLRNKIRLKLIPLLQEINPSIKKSLADTARHLSEAADIYNKYINEGKKEVSTDKGINIQLLQEAESPKAILFGILHPLGFRPEQIDSAFDLLNSQPGKFLVSSTGYRITRDRDFLLLDKPMENNRMPHLIIKEKIYSPDFIIPSDKDTACLDADKITQPFQLRKWQHGDSFIPFGMKGRKLISDYMTDRKFSITQKERQWLLCSGEDIVWVIGERIDNRFRIDKNTTRLLELRIMD